MKKGSPRQGQTGKDDREARLKAALKANLARRKAQMRARAAGGDGRPSGKTPQAGE